MTTISRDTMNTLKDLRRRLGISQSELAAEAGVSRHSVLRMEQLVYPHPLPNIIAALSDIEGTSESELEAAYLKDVANNRSLSATIYFSNPLLMRRCYQFALDDAATSGKHPFQIWRELLFEVLDENDSRIHFCIVTSIHPATLDKYESFKTGFTDSIALALSECGIPDDLLSSFKSHAAFNAVSD